MSRLSSAAACVLLFVAGCSSAPEMPETPPTPPVANALPSSDPRAAGQTMFYWETWGTEVFDSWPPVDFMLGLLRDEPDLFGPQFSSFGTIPDPNDDLPIGLKRGTLDPSRVHETCAMCHVGKLPDGTLFAGMPNQELDIGRLAAEVNDRWVAAGHASLMDANTEMRSRQLGCGRFDAESGDYPTVVPADFPPYFTLARRTYLNYLGTGANVRTEASLSIYTFGAGSPNAETAKVPFPSDDKVDAFLEFFGNIDPPKAPAGDATRVARGQQVFTTARCGSCHHVGQLELDEVTPVSEDGSEKIPGDDPIFEKGLISTDLAHRVLIDGADPLGGGGSGPDQGYLDLLKFIGDHGLGIHLTDGYRVNDLRGLWATAPYLHNGSVPTLEDLLEIPAERPKSFVRGGFTVDTTAPGSSNVGHGFGTELSTDDKTALVAYLKTL